MRDSPEVSRHAVSGRWRTVWSGWSLARQFLTCAVLVLVPAMWIMGLWVSHRIQLGVTARAGAATALYMENFLEPLVQDMANGGQLGPESMVRLAHLLTDHPSLGQRVHTFKIWGPGGIVVAASRPEHVGRRYPPSAGLTGAWQGIVKAEFDHLTEAENRLEKNTGVPLLEVYIPLRARSSDQIIAVGEFYEAAKDLQHDILKARSLSWLVVSAVALAMLTALFGIVRRGSETIELQREALQSRVDELTAIADENRRLRTRGQRASARASQTSERYLRRLGADLHDGPAQLISLALMQLGDIATPARAGAAVTSQVPGRGPGTVSGPGPGPVLGPGPDLAKTRAVLSQALSDIRNLAQGLAIPEIEHASLRDAIQTAVERHRSLTGTAVDLRCGALPDIVSPGLKVVAYRFVQEGLTNAFRHAGGAGQRVRASQTGDVILIEVEDGGRGIDASIGDQSSRLGVKGLRARIESVGGTLGVASTLGRGTLLTAHLPIDLEGADHD